MTMAKARIGNMRHKAVLYQNRPTARDDYNDPTEENVTLIDGLWVSLEELSGTELEMAHQIHPKATLKSECRWPGFDILAGMYMKINGRFFEILYSGNIQDVDRLYRLLLTETQGIVTREA